MVPRVVLYLKHGEMVLNIEEDDQSAQEVCELKA